MQGQIFFLNLLNKELFRIRNSAAVLSAAVMKKDREAETSPGGFPPGFRFLYLFNESYLVDPASSHMLVSKIKPCMSKYKQLCTVKLRMAH